MNMTLQDIAQAMGTCCDTGGDLRVQHVQIDSRKVQPGDLFFCIVGQRLDGHHFVQQAIAAGAGAVVASTPLDVSVPVLMVRDTTLALGQLARAWRERTRAVVIGVTGSAGKTTVKEMLALGLAEAGPTSKNFRNLNNQIGLPLSLLSMPLEDAFWVLELGISVQGDMDQLGYILSPDAVVITNIGPCHLEGLGSLAGVAREKCVLLQHVRPQGLACINGDYPLLVAECALHAGRQVLFSASAPQAAYRCSATAARADRALFDVHTPRGMQHFDVPAAIHVSENMAAVAALCMELGVEPSVIEKGLQAYAPVPQRFVCSQVGSWTFIDDTYNANPVSMARSLAEATRLAHGRPLVLVLGDMLELGAQASAAHQELGRAIASTTCSHCFFYGRHAEDVASGLHGFAGVFAPLHNAEDILRELANLRSAHGVMLFKGSRGCNMEHFYSFLERNWA
ncbi:UDP-N-acetylmuramoyl-tripeptide--D-alanyl-D-alanine ligase [Desulfovibrionales bacterium]